MSQTNIIITVLVIVALGAVALSSVYSQWEGVVKESIEANVDVNSKENESSKVVSQIEAEKSSPVTITPVSHASMVLNWSKQIFYVDPVGKAEDWASLPTADIILLTDIHGDHFNLDTLKAIVASNTVIIAPSAVSDLLSKDLLAQTKVLQNGESLSLPGTLANLNFKLEAIPMYNLPEEDPDGRHAKGRGNGYVIDDGSFRVYIAGDTEDIPEMRALQNIDIAFIPMNLPYTMDEEQAASGTLAFAPKQVYPYHFRTPEGFSDVNKFKALVEAGNKDIEVIILDWYPETEADLAPIPAL